MDARDRRLIRYHSILFVIALLGYFVGYFLGDDSVIRSPDGSLGIRRFHQHRKSEKYFGPYNKWRMPPCSYGAGILIHIGCATPVEK